MDWAGWALFGLVATAALTVVMVAAQLAGLTRLDLPLLLGTIVTADPDRARVAGFFIHLAIGLGFALGYAASFALLDEATWWLGGLLGLLHVAVALTVLVPLLPGIHPRIASDRAGPTTTSRVGAARTGRPELRTPNPERGHRRPPRLRHRPRRTHRGGLRCRDRSPTPAQSTPDPISPSRTTGSSATHAPQPWSPLTAPSTGCACLASTARRCSAASSEGQTPGRSGWVRRAKRPSSCAATGRAPPAWRRRGALNMAA